jgi:ElaB/YqjD/DUF883 family membrane-anchored ribosome-binding protein
MELTEELLRKIENFLEGKLSVEEKRAFELRVEAEHDLKEEIASQRRLRNAIEVLKTKERLKQAYAIYEGRNKVRPLARPVWQTYAVAAAIVGVMLGITYFGTDVFKPESEVAFNEFYRPEMSARGECPQDLPWFKLYEEKQYEDALAGVVGQKDDSTHCVRYFIGINQLALAKLPQAILSLQIAQTSPDIAIRRKAEWYL